MSTHILCFLADMRKIMYTPVNPSFTCTIWRCGLKVSKWYRLVFVMAWAVWSVPSLSTYIIICYYTKKEKPWSKFTEWAESWLGKYVIKPICSCWLCNCFTVMPYESRFGPNNPKYYRSEFYFCELYRCVYFDKSLTNQIKLECLYVKFVSNSLEFTHW